MSLKIHAPRRGTLGVGQGLCGTRAVGDQRMEASAPAWAAGSGALAPAAKPLPSLSCYSRRVNGEWKGPREGRRVQLLLAVSEGQSPTIEPGCARHREALGNASPRPYGLEGQV